MKKCIDCGSLNSVESNFCTVCSSENLIICDEIGEIGTQAAAQTANPAPQVTPISQAAAAQMPPHSASKTVKQGAVYKRAVAAEPPTDFTFTDDFLPLEDQNMPAPQAENVPLGYSAGNIPAADFFAQPTLTEKKRAQEELEIAEYDKAKRRREEQSAVSALSEPLNDAACAAAGQTEYAAANGAQQGETAVVQAETPNGGVECPYCKSAEINLLDVFCPSCGRNVEQFNYGRVVQRKKCPQCSTSCDLNARFCTYCFSPLANAERDIFNVDYIEAARTGNEIIHKAVLVSQTGKKWQLCPSCNTLCELSDTVCGKCGARLEVDFEHKYCYNCGSQNPSDAQFCYHCRYSFYGGGVAKGVWRCECSQLNDDSCLYCTKCGRLYKNKPAAVNNNMPLTK